MPNGDCSTGARNESDVKHLDGKVNTLFKKYDALDEKVDKMRECLRDIKKKFKFLSWVLSVFTVVGTALLVTYFTKLIWGA